MEQHQLIEQAAANPHSIDASSKSSVRRSRKSREYSYDDDDAAFLRQLEQMTKEGKVCLLYTSPSPRDS